MDVSELKRALLELLRENAEFRLAVAGAIGLGEVFSKLEELSAQMLEHTKAIRSLQEQVANHSKVLEEHTKAIQQLTRALSAIGARWGVLAEEAFRDAMKGIVEEIFGGRADKWVYYDERGKVFGHPSWVEVDLVVRDSEHVLIEVKASVSKGDVYELWAAGRLYEEVTGRKPRLAIVSPFVDRRGRELAKELGIELYTGYEL